MIRMLKIALIIISTCPFFAKAQYLADNKATSPRTGTYGPVSNEAPKKAPARLAPWQKGEDQTNGNINRNSLTRLKATNTTLVSFLKDSCLADSTLHPVWHGEYTAEKADKKAAAVSLSYGIRCNFAQSSVLSIMANDLNPLLRHIEVYGQDYTVLVVIPTVRNECPHFEPAARSSAANPVSASKTRIWLVTAKPD